MSLVVIPSVGEVSATWDGAAAHACCGEIVNPHSRAEEIVDPIKISKKKNEAIVFFPRGIPVLFGIPIFFIKYNRTHSIMNSIESLRLDFNTQISELGKIDNDEISDSLIFVGSGDSYVAGLIAEYLTHHKCKSYSPSDLLNSELSKDRTYCFVSVTGKTRANISVAKRASQAGCKTAAITFNENSKLAKVCDKTIRPNVKRVHTPTAGFGSFVANVVTCLQVCGITVPKKFGMWYQNAVKISQNVLDSLVFSADTVFVLGNNVLYPIALYTSLQMAEFFGTTVVAHKLEEFCHSPIFGLKSSDSVWILGQNESQVNQRLQMLGLSLSYIELYNPDILAQLFQSIFYVQNLMLLLAERHGLEELQYVTMKNILKASSDIIYERT